MMMKRIIELIKNKFIKSFKGFLLLSIGLNVVTACIKMIMGIVIPSLYFGFNAGYYIVLCIVRLILYIGVKNAEEKKLQKVEKMQIHRMCGLIMIMLSSAYFAMSVQMYRKGELCTYKGYIVYIVALVAFSKLGIAIYGRMITHHKHEPIIAAIKQVNFADAMVSIVVTEYALLQMKNESDVNIWSGISGMGVSVVILMHGVLMVIRAHRYNKNLLD